MALRRPVIGVELAGGRGGGDEGGGGGEGGDGSEVFMFYFVSQITLYYKVMDQTWLSFVQFDPFRVGVPGRDRDPGCYPGLFISAPSGQAERFRSTNIFVYHPPSGQRRVNRVLPFGQRMR